MFSGFCPPDEDDPNYAIWERGMLETIERYAAQQDKASTAAQEQPVQKKAFAENNSQKRGPLYSDWNRRVREAEERLFKKENKKRSQIGAEKKG